MRAAYHRGSDLGCSSSFAAQNASVPMSAERLAQLRALLADEPGDAFLRYAIALESWGVLRPRALTGPISGMVMLPPASTE